MHNLIEDVSTLTTIGKYNLESLVDIVTSIISHDVVEDIKTQQPITSVDVGIGVLHITIQDDVLRYKFVPSRKLENCIRTTYISGESDLLTKVDEALGNRIMKTYKDLF